MKDEEHRQLIEEVNNLNEQMGESRKKQQVALGNYEQLI